MNLKIQRSHLLNALNTVHPAIAGKHPFAGFVLLSAKDGKLTVIADSIQIRAEATVDCEVAEPGSAVVAQAKLMPWVQRDFAWLELKMDKDRLKIIAEGVEARLPTMAADDFVPSRTCGDQKAFVVLDGPAFAKCVNIAAATAGDGPQQDWNSSVCLKDDGAEMRVIATDGKELAFIALPTSGETFSVAIPATSLKAITKPCEAAESLTMAVFEKFTRFDADGAVFYLAESATEYSDLPERIIPDYEGKLTGQVIVNREALLQALSGAAAMMDRDEWKVFIEPTANALVVSAEGKSSESIPVKCEPAPEKRVAHANLIAHLRLLDCENIVLRYNTGDHSQFPHAILVTPEGVEAQKWLAMLMR
jgi:DNA polymerase III sliding clamp (beta) subunit (PCNA family)